MTDLDRYLAHLRKHGGCRSDIKTLVTIIGILSEWITGVAPYLATHGQDLGADEGKELDRLAREAMGEAEPSKETANGEGTETA